MHLHRPYFQSSGKKKKLLKASLIVPTATNFIAQLVNVDKIISWELLFSIIKFEQIVRLPQIKFQGASYFDLHYFATVNEFEL